MDNILNYLVDNTVLVLAAVGAVFTVLTLLMLISSIISNGMTRKQLRLLSRALQSQQKPKVVPKFSTVEGRIKCLTFENIGNGYAKNIRVELNQEWIDAKARLTDYSHNTAVLINLKNNSFFLSAKESISFGLFRAIEDSYEIDTLKNQRLELTVYYEDAVNQKYQEDFALELVTHEGTLQAASSEINRIIREAGDKIDALKGPIGRIEPAVSKIEPAISAFAYASGNIEPQLREMNASFKEVDKKIMDLIELYQESLDVNKKSLSISKSAIKGKLANTNKDE